MTGRPTIYSEKLVVEICRRLAAGETLRAMCREDEALPHRDTVNEWLVSKPGFSDRVADARRLGSHSIIEENRDIADDGSNDWMEKMGRDGQPIGWVLNGEHVQRSKLRIDQRWREAEAILPQVYGKMQRVEHSGGITVSLINATEEEITQELLDMLASGRLKLPGGVEVMELDEEPEDDFSDIC